jgi:4-hydroxy-tetrahydrodipicolinate reductase
MAEKPIRVAVLGAAGRMGAMVCRTVVAEPGLELVAAVDPHNEGVDVSRLTGAEVPGLQAAGSPEALAAAKADVAVDFTVIGAARTSLEWCAANGVHAVVGTSGFSESDYESIRKHFKTSNCIIAPNFAIGAVLMMRLAEIAAPYFESAEIIETHHDGKLDAPSGTALRTAERMAAASADWAPDPTEKQTVKGTRGGEGPGGIRIHSMRLRGSVAHQEIVLGTTGQSLTIRHDSYDRASFMPGVVAAVKAVAGLPGLTVGLDKVLGL